MAKAKVAKIPDWAVGLPLAVFAAAASFFHFDLLDLLVVHVTPSDLRTKLLQFQGSTPRRGPCPRDSSSRNWAAGRTALWTERVSGGWSFAPTTGSSWEAA